MRPGNTASMDRPSFTRLARLRSVPARPLAAAFALGVGLWAVPADAHIALTSPMARYAQEHQKAEPCGHPDNPPGDGPVATYQAGETITIEIDEFINHSGHLRVALDPTGTDDFTSPTAFDDFYNSPQVLLDDIPDMQNGGVHMIEVTLPEEPCDPCTLQVIQVMNDGAWGPGLSDLYFQCADIVIESVGSGTAGETTSGGEDDTGPGDSTGGGGEGSSGGNGSEGPGGSEGPDDGATMGDGTGGGNPGGSDTTGPGGSDEDGGGCACRVDRRSHGAVPWLLVGLFAWRRRRASRR